MVFSTQEEGQGLAGTMTSYLIGLAKKVECIYIVTE